MAGAGILALAHAGMHNTKQATATGDWILKHPFDQYNQNVTYQDRYHYGVFHCCQAMYQLGGRYWKEFYPPTVRTLMTNQRRNGSWAPELGQEYYGNSYTTALVVLALAAPNQLLPVYQR